MSFKTHFPVRRFHNLPRRQPALVFSLSFGRHHENLTVELARASQRQFVERPGRRIDLILVRPLRKGDVLVDEILVPAGGDQHHVAAGQLRGPPLCRSGSHRRTARHRSQ